MKPQLCVALDVSDSTEALGWTKRLSPWVDVFKIGLQLFVSEGPRIVDAVHKGGGKVFLDLKFHDIPSTVTNAAREAVRSGVFMLNVHCMGGRTMMRSVSDGVIEETKKLDCQKPLVLGVTVLTSLSNQELSSELNIRKSMQNYVMHLAKMSEAAGLDGAVCSPHEVRGLRNALSNDFILVVPGIRPLSHTGKDDQVRTATATNVVRNGGNFLVVGRPILQADDPEKTVQDIVAEIDFAKNG